MVKEFKSQSNKTSPFKRSSPGNNIKKFNNSLPSTVTIKKIDKITSDSTTKAIQECPFQKIFKDVNRELNSNFEEKKRLNDDDFDREIENIQEESKY